jgi:hypothetical protein
MDKKAIDKVCSQVYRRFPPVKNASPKVSKQGDTRYLLIFSSSGEGPDGKKIQHTVRVVASADGRILKTSMSR